MTFSIKATIRAFWVPNHQLVCPTSLWHQIVSELNLRGENQHEAGAFLLGTKENDRSKVVSAIYYDELDPDAYSSGVCVLHGDAFAQLWARCREGGYTVVADIHTHQCAGFQSYTDKTNPMVARDGHIAIILPDFARWPISKHRMGIYEYLGQHQWTDRSPSSAQNFLYTGFWS